MKTLKSTLLVAVLLFFGTSFTIGQNNTHFDFCGGNPMQPSWNIYLQTVTDTEGNTPQSDDELAVYDGTTLVGLFTFDDWNNSGGTYDNELVAWSGLACGDGYTGGNDVTFIFWDDSEGAELVADDDDITWDVNENGFGYSPDWDPYFPSTDGESSFIDIDFSATIYTVDGSFNLDADYIGYEEEASDFTAQLVDLSNYQVVGQATCEDNTGGAAGGGDYYYSITAPDLSNVLSGVDYRVEFVNSEQTVDDAATTFHEFGISSFSGNSYTAPLNTVFLESNSISGSISSAANGVAQSATVKLYQGTVSGTEEDSETSSGGTYTFNNVMNGDYTVEADKANYESNTSDLLTIADSDTSGVDIELTPEPFTLIGEVTDGSGDNLEGVEIKGEDDEENVLFTAYTNSLGAYSVSDVPSEISIELTASKPLFNESTSQVAGSPNSTITRDFTLNPLDGTFQGSVTSTETQQAMENVAVDVIGDGESGVSTDVNGAYSIDVPAGTYDIKFSKSGFSTVTMTGQSVASGQMTIVSTQLSPQASVTVHVENGSNSNIGGATVTIDGQSPTGANGSGGDYEFTDLGSGSHTLSVVHGSYKNYESTIDLDAGTNDQVDVVLYSEKWSQPSPMPTSKIWTIYLRSATIEENNLEAGDEIAIYDNSIGTSDGDEVGVYYVNETLTPGSANSHYMSAYSSIDGGTGYSSGNDYIFKFWDASADVVYTLEQDEVQLKDPYSSGIPYTGDVFPSSQDPYSFAELSFVDESATITINLESGYNLVSSNVEPNQTGMKDILIDGYGGDSDPLTAPSTYLDFVKGESGSMFKKYAAPTGWDGSLSDWNVEEGYLFYMSSSSNSFTIDGEEVDVDREIPLDAGYNFVPYYPSTSIDPQTAFGTILDNLELVRNTGSDHFRKVGGVWTDNLPPLEAGEGYLVKMNAADVLTYPTSSRKNAVNVSKEGELKHFEFSSGNPNKDVYSIYVDGLSKGDEIAAFDGDKMVGASVIDSKEDRMENELNLFSVLSEEESGYTPGNEITFKVWSNSKNQVYSNVNVIYHNPHGDAWTSNTFPSGDNVYSVIQVKDALIGVDELTELKNNIKMYPNPVSSVLNLELPEEVQLVEVFNAMGQKVQALETVDSKVSLATGQLNSGVYLIEFTTNNNSITKRFIVR